MDTPDRALFSAPRPDLAEIECRFGCTSPVVGIFHVPAGCVCWDDPVQALCAQHAARVQSAGPITCVFDFADPMGERVSSSRGG